MVDESDTSNVPAYMAAVKLLKGDPSGEQREEFLREAIVMAQFNHPNGTFHFPLLVDMLDIHMLPPLPCSVESCGCGDQGRPRDACDSVL